MSRELALANSGDCRLASLPTDTIREASQQRGDAAYRRRISLPQRLFAYVMAVEHGIDVGRPRNLTKAVTTE